MIPMHEKICQAIIRETELDPSTTRFSSIHHIEKETQTFRVDYLLNGKEDFVELEFQDSSMQSSLFFQNIFDALTNEILERITKPAGVTI